MDNSKYTQAIIFRLDWPVRTISFSHDSQVIASASEDPFIDIASTFTGVYMNNAACVHTVCES